MSANGNRTAPVPPHDLVAEQSLLGAMLMSRAAIAAAIEVCGADDFYKRAHAHVFSAITSLYGKGEPCDPVTVAGQLRADGLLEVVGGPAVLTTLQFATPASSNARRYASMVLEAAMRRRVATASVDVYSAAMDPSVRASLIGERVAELAAVADMIAGSGATPVLVRVSDVKAERVEWVWPGYVPRGKPVMFDGDPGQGKSTLTLDLTARISTGSPMPDGYRPSAPGGVVLLSAEDGVADTIRPRLEAAGADLDRVVVLDSVRRDGGTPVPASLPADVDAVRQAIQAVDAVLVIVDPVMAFLGESVNSYNDTKVRVALHPLKILGEQTGAALMFVRHLRKAAVVNALYAGGGSIGFIGAARVGLIVAPDPDDDRGRVLAVTKSNLAAIPTSLAYRLVGDDEHGCARVAWSGPSDYSAADLLAPRASEDDRDGTDAAVLFLREFLGSGPQLALDVKKAGKAAGIGERSLDRARKKAGVTTKREGFGQGGRWRWHLDTTDRSRRPVDQRGHRRHVPKDGINGENGNGSGLTELHPGPCDRCGKPTRRRSGDGARRHAACEPRDGPTSSTDHEPEVVTWRF